MPQKVRAVTSSGPVPGSTWSEADRADNRLLNVAALTFWFHIYFLLCEQTIQHCEKMDEEDMPTTVEDEERSTTMYNHLIGELKGRTVIEEAGVEIFDLHALGNGRFLRNVHHGLSQRYVPKWYSDPVDDQAK
jgi:hypothetical protein